MAIVGARSRAEARLPPGAEFRSSCGRQSGQFVVWLVTLLPVLSDVVIGGAASGPGTVVVAPAPVPVAPCSTRTTTPPAAAAPTGPPPRRPLPRLQPLRSPIPVYRRRAWRLEVPGSAPISIRTALRRLCTG